MANFDTIKTAIDANIKTNGTQDITGGKMNFILKQMVDATDEQLTELESKSNELDARIDTIINYIPDFTNNQNGELIGAKGMAVSDYIPIEVNQKYICHYGQLLTLGYAILYDENKQCVDYYSFSMQATEREIQTLSAVFLRFAFSLGDKADVKLAKDGTSVWMPKDASMMHNDILKTVNNLGLAVSDIVESYPNYRKGLILNDPGEFVKMSGYSTSPLIYVANAKSIIITAGNIEIPVNFITYDENANYIDYFSIETISKRREHLNDGFAYIRFSFRDFGNVKDEKGNILWEQTLYVDEIGQNSTKLNHMINYTPNYVVLAKGTQYPSKGMAVSDYIQVEQNGLYNCYFGYNVNGCIVLYDSNKQFLDYYTLPLTIPLREISSLAASYIRISFNMQEMKDVYVKKDNNEVWKPTPSLTELNERIEIIENPIKEKSSYDGEPINLSSMEFYTMFVNSYQGIIQDACSYADVMFQFFLQEEYETPECRIYDLKTGAIIQDMKIPHNAYSHNNVAVFGVEKYDENDEFPMLYLSTLQRDGQHAVGVFRITGERGKYQCSLMQRIDVEKPNAIVKEPNAFVDKSGFLYIAWMDVVNSVNIIEKYSLPSIYESNVSLKNSDKIDSFEISNRYPYGETIGEPEQGGEIYNGKLYYAMGFASCAWLMVVDLQRKKIVSTIDLTSLGLDYEPEGAFIWRGSLCIPFNESGKVVRFIFD